MRTLPSFPPGDGSLGPVRTYRELSAGRREDCRPRESVLRHGGFAALAGRAPEQLIRWEADYGWTRRGFGLVAERETLLAVPLALLLATPDMWRTFAEAYLEALEAAGRADPKRPRTVYGTFDETSYRRKERTDDLATWHEMLLDRFGNPRGRTAGPAHRQPSARRARTHLPARQDRRAPR